MSAVVILARDWIGTPYLHQASVKGAACDCLGLIRGVWRDLHGVEPEKVPPYTPDWSEPQGEEVLWRAAIRHCAPAHGDLKAGQIILFRMRPTAIAKHLGIAAETGDSPTFIHAYTGHGVVESPLSTPWRAKIVARFAFKEV